MPTKIKIIHTKDFISAKPDGSMDLKASLNLLRDLVTEIETTGEHLILVDVRNVDVRLSTCDNYILGKAIAEKSFHIYQKKFALLIQPSDNENAHFLESVSRNRGSNLKVFTDFEPAISWLIMENNSE
jgi:hypothetical protein